MLFFNRTDHFQIIRGSAPIVVGAPHHGTRPNVDADMGTGPIALALAEKLNSRAVIVSDLRRTVDVNKNPANMGRSVVHHAVRYQNEMFANFPRLVIEIHGHVLGQYPVEVTSGFDLDPDAPGDAAFLDRLRALKQSLPNALAGKVGKAYDTGVYPLDRDVKKTATNTFTFQKIRRARNLTGQEWYGIHIELAADLRTSDHAKSDGYADALADALAQSIRSAFEPLPAQGDSIPIRADMLSEESEASQGVKFKVITASENTISENAVTLHPKDFEELGVLPGDSISLSNHGEELRTTAKSSSSIRQGHAAIPSRLRAQLNINPKDYIAIKRSASGRSRNIEAQTAYPYFVTGEIRQQNASRIWANPEDIEQLGIQSGSGVFIKQPNVPAANSVTLEADSTIAKRVVAISADLAKRLTITIGEVFMIEAKREH
jgi:formylmethanofuran dehydrogenase subunit D